MLWFDQEILGSPVEGVEVNISCQTEDLGNVTPTLRLTMLGLAAQTRAGVETLLHIAIVLDVLTTDLVGYQLKGMMFIGVLFYTGGGNV